MSLLTSFFYSISVIFIITEIYQLINRDKLFSRIEFDDINEYNTKKSIIFYISKLIYLIWLPIGLFSSFWIYFLLIIILGLCKYSVLYTKKNVLINLYDLFNTILSVFLLSIIFLQALFR